MDRPVTVHDLAANLAENHVMLVAEEDGLIVGMVGLFVAPFLFNREFIAAGRPGRALTLLRLPPLRLGCFRTWGYLLGCAHAKYGYGELGPMIRVCTLMMELAPAGEGINKAFRAIVRTNDGDLEAFVKKVPMREVLVELVAAVMARRLSLPVPEPLLVYVPHQLGGPFLAFGSVSLHGKPTLGALVNAGDTAVAKQLKGWKHLIPAACFDEWIANCDRHNGNLLCSGEGEFWLIDHGLSIHEGLSMDQASPINQLFALAVDGLTEGDLLTLRPSVLGVMQSYAELSSPVSSDSIPTALWDEQVVSSIHAWLSGRQNHLVRLGGARVPARQSELFDGRH